MIYSALQLSVVDWQCITTFRDWLTVHYHLQWLIESALLLLKDWRTRSPSVYYWQYIKTFIGCLAILLQWMIVSALLFQWMIYSALLLHWMIGNVLLSSKIIGSALHPSFRWLSVHYIFHLDDCQCITLSVDDLQWITPSLAVHYVLPLDDFQCITLSVDDLQYITP